MIILAGWLFGGKGRVEGTQRHMPRVEEERKRKLGGSGALKNKTRKITASTYHAPAKAALQIHFNNRTFQAECRSDLHKKNQKMQPAAIHHKKKSCTSWEGIIIYWCSNHINLMFQLRGS